MSVEFPGAEEDPQDLADWFELEALLSASGEALMASVATPIEIEEDFEPEAIHWEDDIVEAVQQDISRTISERIECLGSSYPFSWHEDDASLVLDPDPTTGGWSYLFCLITSQSATGEMLWNRGVDMVAARDLFQVIATVAAAGLSGGPAYSFGWPRPDGTSFHAKLQQVWGHFGDGTPHPTVPDGAPPFIKDGGIDVVSWPHESDGLPRVNYIVGQAASGADWQDKGVQEDVRALHQFWFVRQPVSACNPAIFIPFCLKPRGFGRTFVTEEDRRGNVDWLTIRLGIIQYRLRLPRDVDRAEHVVRAGVNPVEGWERMPEVEEWVREQSRLLREDA